MQWRLTIQVQVQLNAATVNNQYVVLYDITWDTQETSSNSKHGEFRSDANLIQGWGDPDPIQIQGTN